jgi:hypothetical protein
MELIDRIIDDASYWASSSIYMEHPPVSIRKDGKKEEHLMYLRTLPVGIPGTEGDFSLVEEDFEDGGAAWTKKLQVGCPEDPPTRSRPCRKIEFQLWCHNHLAARYPQTFSDSFMWFDVIIEKLQTPVFTHDIVEWPAHFFFDEIDPDTARPFLHSDRMFEKMVALSQTEKHRIIWHFRDSCNSATATNWNFLNSSFDKDLARAAYAAGLVRDMQPGDSIAVRARSRFPDSESLVQKAKIIVYWAV